MPNVTKTPAQPWWANRELAIEKRLKDLKVGDAINCNDGKITIVYIFLNSKLPQYIIYSGDKKVFPTGKASTPKREDILDYILQKNEKDRGYINHIGMKYVKNGGMRYMPYIPSDVVDVKEKEENNEPDKASGQNWDRRLAQFS